MSDPEQIPAFPSALLVCGQMTGESLWPCNHPPGHSSSHGNGWTGWMRQPVEPCVPEGGAYFTQEFPAPCCKLTHIPPF